MDDQNAQPTPYDEIKAQLNQLTQGLGQFAQHVDARFQQVGQAVSQRQPAQPQKTAPPISMDAANAQLLEQIGTAPVRVFGEAIATAKQEAVAEVERRLAQEREEQMARAQEQAFWQGFQQFNADVAPFMPMVWDHWQRLGNIPDPSARADKAAEMTRALLAQQRADAIEAERRQAAGKRMVSMPPGFPMAQPGADGQPAEPRGSRERLDDIMAEHNARRAQTSWQKIATPEYHQQAQARAANTRLIRQRVA